MVPKQTQQVEASTGRRARGSKHGGRRARPPAAGRGRRGHLLQRPSLRQLLRVPAAAGLPSTPAPGPPAAPARRRRQAGQSAHPLLGAGDGGGGPQESVE